MVLCTLQACAVTAVEIDFGSTIYDSETMHLFIQHQMRVVCSTPSLA